eukprot:SAG31_NODE_8639_length_1416_cov_1.135156_1_plen_272_part_10
MQILDPDLIERLTYIMPGHIEEKEAKTQASQALLEQCINSLQMHEAGDPSRKWRDDELEDAQLFVLEMSKIPAGGPRVRSWFFYMTSDDMLEPVKGSISNFKAAMQEVHTCLRFKAVLKIIFDVGSYLNEGTYNAKVGGRPVKGFDVDTLEKVTDVRGAIEHGKEKTNLLRYVADVCERKYPILQDFAKEGIEWDFVRKAVSIDFEGVVGAYKFADKQLKEHSEFLVRIKADPSLGNPFWAKYKIVNGERKYISPRSFVTNIFLALLPGTDV